MSARPTKAALDRATLKRDIARAKLDAAIATKRTAILNRWDVLEQTKKRRQPRIERQTEDKQLKTYDRLSGINLGRDLERNFTSMRSIMHQLRTNVVGTGPKLRVHLRGEMPDDPAVRESTSRTLTQWASWFNGEWAKDCDYRDDQHWAKHVGYVLSGVIREGDILPWFDGGHIEDSGKCGFFEADQLATPDDPSNLPEPWKSLNVEQGVFFDTWGRVRGYACSRNHGVMQDKVANLTFIPRGDVARLIKFQLRPGQLRGTPLMLTAAADMQDLYEMRAKELQTAKVGAGVFATVHKEDGGIGDLALKRGWDEAGGVADGATAPAGGQTQYDRLEAFAGGAMEYMSKDEKIDIKDFNRPSVNFRESYDWTLRSAGAAFGLTKTYSSMHTEASYTAFRGDLLIAWASFYVYQKDLERQYCDWIARNALGWGVRNGKIDSGGLTVDQVAYSWDWTKQPSPDPLKEAMAAETNLRNNLEDYASLLGPDWRKRFDALVEQMKYAKDPARQLPLSPWEGERTAITFDDGNGGAPLRATP